ncbi:MAG: type IV pilus assembly protein PilM [Planctomycetota bacterium]|nr:type IV pilus assembly protein PilM [Planctomycetota bacterium]
MAKVQAVWAIDIGQVALKALKVVPGDTPDQMVVEEMARIEYPKILSQPDADPDELVRMALIEFLEKHSTKGCRIAIGVPGQKGLIKFIKLPPVEKKRIPEIVQYEAKQQIPFPLNEVVWDYQQLASEDDDDAGDDDEMSFTMAEVGLFAMKREEINKALFPLRRLGLEPDIVQMTPIALYNFATYELIKGRGEKGPIVVLDMGADKTECVITDGNRIWQRNVPIGGNHFTRALTKEMKLVFAKAEATKRDAATSADMKAVFTAMKGVFKDFSTEIQRTIGFYGSVNKGSKVKKIIGLGNGFKLPGLTTFLQQELDIPVEALTSFTRLSGEALEEAGFADNAASFAISYGLAAQAFSKQTIQTTLLPPDIKQARLVRKKKPLVLAASLLFMLGFTAMFLGTVKAWTKVNNSEFTSAVESAKSVATKGASLKSDYEAAKGAFSSEKIKGDSLVVSNNEKLMWPQLLQTINAYMPDPVTEKKLNVTSPSDQLRLAKLAVHIDQIKPAYRNDLAVEWYDTLDSVNPSAKSTMAPYDVKEGNTPTGEGWVIQIVGHHYNPYPGKVKNEDNMGPLGYIRNDILKRLQGAGPRRFGLSHAALVWMTEDKQWTTEKAASTNGLSANAIPLIAAVGPVGGGGGEGGGAGAEGGMAAMMGMMGGMGGGGKGGMGDMQEAAGGGGMSRGMMGMMGGGMGGGADAKAKEKLTFLVRTDFLIQMVWKPLSEENVPKSLEELQAALTEAAKETNAAPPKEMDFVSKSLEQSKLRAKMYERLGTGPGAKSAEEGGADATKASGAAAAPGSN